MKSEDFSFLPRVHQTNIEGKRTAAYALTRILGIGRRFAHLVCAKAEINPKKRAGELTEEEIKKIENIIKNPREAGIPDWFLNRPKDMKTGKNMHLTTNQIASRFREDIERFKKIRLHRALRHIWGFRVRGQHQKTTGRGRVNHHLKMLGK